MSTNSSNVCRSSATGRIVGTYETNETGGLVLVKRNLDPEKHKLHSPSGWATDVEHLDELRAHQERTGKRSLVLVHATTGEVWEASLDTFDHYGQRFNRLHGEQMVLPDRYWRQVDGPRAQLVLFLPHPHLQSAGGMR